MTAAGYVKALEPARRKEFAALRAWVRKTLPEASETMGYKMPTYELGGERVCAIAAQKHYFALYVCESQALERRRGDFAHLDVGKGCIRFKAVADLPRTAAARVLREAAREAGG